MAKPVRARIYYKIEEKMCERGNYLIKGSKIPGYRNYYYKNLKFSSQLLAMICAKILAVLHDIWTFGDENGIEYGTYRETE